MTLRARRTRLLMTMPESVSDAGAEEAWPFSAFTILTLELNVTVGNGEAKKIRSEPGFWRRFDYDYNYVYEKPLRFLRLCGKKHQSTQLVERGRGF